MKIKIPSDQDFDFYACKKLYKKYQKQIGDYVSFNQIIQNTFFYSFYDGKNLVGCIYLYRKRKKLYMNGFANRKYHQFNIDAVKKIFKWFCCDIYAKSHQKSAIFLLLKCGFQKISDNTFVYYNNGLSQKGN